LKGGLIVAMEEASLTAAAREGNTYCKQVKEKCIQLLKEGKTISEIVKIISGPKQRSVKRYAKAFGLEIVKGKWTGKSC
jgi:hypothetical protein